MISEVIGVSLGLSVFALLITAAISPLETLSWWAGWSDDEIDSETVTPPPAAPGDASLYVIYLSGVASLSGDYLIARERIFIRELEARLPGSKIIADVFPYSPAGTPLLASPRVFERFWRWLQKLNLQGRRSILKALINLRNIYQVMVAADHRYGPIFSQGAAETIERSLRKAGYQIGAPVAIIGYSGGAQVAIGAAPFLRDRLNCSIDVISIGGVVASDPGLRSIRKLTHLHGRNDLIEKVGALFFAERWAIFANSHWNSAKRDGCITIKTMDQIGHAGPKGYFGLPRRGPQSNNDRTVDTVATILGSINRPAS